MKKRILSLLMVGAMTAGMLAGCIFPMVLLISLAAMKLSQRKKRSIK